MKKDCLKLYVPGEFAYLYPSKEVIAPSSRYVDYDLIKSVKVAGAADETLLLEDGREFTVKAYFMENNFLGGYMVCHWSVPTDSPDFMAFPDVKELKNTVEQNFIVNYLVDIVEGNGKRLESIPLKVLRNIYSLICKERGAPESGQKCLEDEQKCPEEPEIPEDVGSIGKDGTIERDYYRQGYVFKSWKNYYSEDDSLPVYVPELTDTIYTKKDIMDLCSGQKEFADELFVFLDWQHPESLLEDWMCNDEWQKCSECGKLSACFEDDGTTRIVVCPHCGSHSFEE